MMKAISHKERHDYLLQNFIFCGRSTSVNKDTHDIDIIKEHHRFLWGENEESLSSASWEIRLAHRYYSKLFKEYCIADLSRYKANKVAMRWRTKDEVITGKGQFQCGSRTCEDREGLRSWEVNFAYKEQGERKNSLVKLRLCAIHSDQLNYTSRKREVKRKKKKIQTMHIPCGVGSSSKSTSFSEAANSRNTYPGEKAHDVEDNIWGRIPDVEVEQISRESEFERYLEDLLL